LKIFTFITLLFINCFVVAQTPLENASENELLDKLVPRAPMTRGLGRNLVPEQQAEKTPISVDLVIAFEFDSAKLRAESLPLLNNLAKVMENEQLKQSTFNIEGHTDSVGNPSYNLKLSKNRALSVVNYLTNQGVNKKRLVAIGKGGADPFNLSDPQAPENRRVKVVLNQ